MISKLVNAVKSHGDVHQEKLEKVLSVVNSMANGQFQIALPGPLTAQLVAPSLATQQLPLVPVPAPVAPLAQTDSASRSQGAPEYILFDARTVADVWREWREGIAGRPPLQGLEETWGHLLRPKPKDKTAWSRRKVVLDELTRLVARGRTEEAAVAELEALRAGRHLRRLIDDLKGRQKARKVG